MDVSPQSHLYMPTCWLSSVAIHVYYTPAIKSVTLLSRRYSLLVFTVGICPADITTDLRERTVANTVDRENLLVTRRP